MLSSTEVKKYVRTGRGKFHALMHWTRIRLWALRNVVIYFRQNI